MDELKQCKRDIQTDLQLVPVFLCLYFPVRENIKGQV